MAFALGKKEKITNKIKSAIFVSYFNKIKTHNWAIKYHNKAKVKL